MKPTKQDRRKLQSFGVKQLAKMVFNLQREVRRLSLVIEKRGLDDNNKAS